MNHHMSGSIAKSKQHVWDERSRPKIRTLDTSFGLLLLDGGSLCFLSAGWERMAGVGRANPGTGGEAA